MKRLWLSMTLRKWVTRELHRGDLQALSKAAHGRYFEMRFDQIKRLRARGFVRNNILGNERITLKGRLALLLRGALSG